MMQSNWGASLTGALLVAAASQVAFGQVLPVTSGPLAPPRPVGHVVSEVPNEVGGVVTDPGGHPLAGAVVSALGSTSVYAVSDRAGRFLLRGLNPGPYLIRAHLQGYVPARGRLVQVGTTPRGSMTITLQKRDAVDEPPAVLAAGVGTAQAPEQARDDETNHDHEEVAWRLRHSKRSVLKEATERIDVEGGEAPETVLAGFGRAVGHSARLASALMPDLELNGQLNLLTSTSFDRPQELFAEGAPLPRGVAFLSLAAPGDDGEYRMHGTITQGDLASWIVSGSYARSAQATHAYEAGVSYAMQRYQGVNAEALNALRGGSRNVGSLYAFDSWTVSPRVRVGYGARYASYDYLGDQFLFSPRADIEIRPLAAESSLRVRVSASRTETAPGAVDFVTPAGGVWLPPERTFSAIGTEMLVPQRVDHMEAGFEQDLGPVVVSARAFRQETTDQVMSVFGAPTGAPASNAGHYYVGAVGDFEARGWGAAVESHIGTRSMAVVDYQQVSAAWSRGLSPASLLVSVPDAGFRRADTVRSLTASIQSVLAPTETRLVVVYRLSTAAGMDWAETDSTAGGGRFEVQINQALPFLAFTNARWEALVAVRNMFYDATAGPSVYDEILVVRPPTRVLGGVTVRF